MCDMVRNKSIMPVPKKLIGGELLKAHDLRVFSPKKKGRTNCQAPFAFSNRWRPTPKPGRILWKRVPPRRCRGGYRRNPEIRMRWRMRCHWRSQVEAMHMIYVWFTWSVLDFYDLYLILSLWSAYEFYMIYMVIIWSIGYTCHYLMIFECFRSKGTSKKSRSVPWNDWFPSYHQKWYCWCLKSC